MNTIDNLDSSSYPDIDVVVLSAKFLTSIKKNIARYIETGKPIILSDIVTGYAGIAGLTFEKGRYQYADYSSAYDGETLDLSDSQSQKVQYVTGVICRALSHEYGVRSGCSATYELSTHYDEKSGQYELLLDFEKTESLIQLTTGQVNQHLE